MDVSGGAAQQMQAPERLQGAGRAAKQTPQSCGWDHEEAPN